MAFTIIIKKLAESEKKTKQLLQMFYGLCARDPEIQGPNFNPE